MHLSTRLATERLSMTGLMILHTYIQKYTHFWDVILDSPFNSHTLLGMTWLTTTLELDLKLDQGGDRSPFVLKDHFLKKNLLS